MEEKLLAQETADIWENIEDMMEEEFEDCASAPARVDPEPELEEARVSFQDKFIEKNLRLERIKTRVEEANKSLQSLKCFQNNHDVDDDELEIRCLMEQIEVAEKEKRGEKSAKDEGQQFLKDREDTDTNKSDSLQ